MDRRRLFKNLFIIFAAVQLLIAFAFASLFFFHDALDLTTSNSALYVSKTSEGGIAISRDMPAGHTSALVFVLNLNRVFHGFMQNLAVAAKKPLLELTWDEEQGRGVIKRFGADGKILSVALSRFYDMGKPHGLFIGGDLPYGDFDRDARESTAGMGYYNGKQWFHIWCAANEGVKFSGSEEVLGPVKWTYLGSRTLKDTYDEVSLESYHEGEIDGKKVFMTRALSFRASDEYVVLDVKFTNPGEETIQYSYSYGDEPWVGEYGSSRGDVGWYENGLIEAEAVIDPVRYKYAGFWDFGNPLAGEDHNYSGYADFVEWLKPVPSFVSFSNGFQCCDARKPINSDKDRDINIVWEDLNLMPGQSITHSLALGLARPGPSGLPIPPVVHLKGNTSGS